MIHQLVWVQITSMTWYLNVNECFLQKFKSYSNVFLVVVVVFFLSSLFSSTHDVTAVVTTGHRVNLMSRFQRSSLLAALSGALVFCWRSCVLVVMRWMEGCLQVPRIQWCFNDALQSWHISLPLDVFLHTVLLRSDGVWNSALLSAILFNVHQICRWCHTTVMHNFRTWSQTNCSFQLWTCFFFYNNMTSFQTAQGLFW